MAAGDFGQQDYGGCSAVTPANPFQTRAFVGNRWLDGSDERDFDVLNPSTGELLARVVDCGAVEAKAALDAANAALPSWRARTASERAALLMQWHALILENKDRLARLISLEQGKMLAESEGEVAYGAEYIRWFAEEARRVYGTVIPEPVAGRRLLVVKESVGVVAVITPWNFPFAMLAREMAPALAAGCTVVARPAEDTPLTALAMADLAAQAGFPPGVLNVIASSRERVEEVTNVWMHADTVRKISFTGSTQVGKAIAARGAQTLKKLSLELGGNAPFIVFDDADIDAAVDGAIAAKFRNSGQTCVSPNRFIVQDTVYEEFATRLVERVRGLSVGDAFSEGALIGPLINERALQKVELHLHDACALGARVMIGGRRSPRCRLFRAHSPD